MPDIESARLLLHALGAAEARAIVAGEPPPGLVAADGFPLPDTADGLGLYLRALATPGFVEGFGAYLVVRTADGIVIGEIGFYGPPTEGAVAIGYGIVPSARRQGFATEAIDAIAGWALARGDVAEVRAEALATNTPSWRALLAAGFEPVGSDGTLRSFRRRVS